MAFGRLKVDELETSTQTVNVDALVGITADGDKGDITVSGSGTVWSIDDGAVDTAALGGDITAAGKALLDDADAAAQRTTLGAEAAGAAASAISTHEAAADPHPGYALESSLGGAALLDVGTTAGTVAAGDDGRFTTDLSYTASTRVLASSTGADATLPLFTSTDAGLTPLSGGGTTNFLRADGTWATPATGGTPGGVTGQIQWNSSGSFAGVGGSTVGATGDITLSLAGAADTPPLKLTGTWFSGGTSTTTKPQFLIEPTGTTSTAWSTSGTGLGVNAASGFNGNLLDLQVNGSTKFYVHSFSGREGVGIGGPVGGNFTPQHGFIINVGLGLVGNNSGSVSSGAITMLIRRGTGAIINDTEALVFGNTNTITLGTKLYQDAAGILAQRNGTNAQTYRLYNTYTDASNYQRTSITDDSTGLVIDQQYAGTGAARTNLLELKDNGTTKLRFDKLGINYGVASAVTTYIGLGSTFGATSGFRLYGDTTTLRFASNHIVGWTANATESFTTLDTALKRDQAGVVAITDGSTGTGYLKQTPIAVSALPAASTVGAGTRGFVSDSTVAASGNFGATVTGGGSNNVPVFSDGTNWLIG